MGRRMRVVMVVVLVWVGVLVSEPKAQGLFGGAAKTKDTVKVEQPRAMQPHDHFEKPARGYANPMEALGQTGSMTTSKETPLASTPADTVTDSACAESLKPEAKVMAASLDRIADILTIQVLLTIGSMVAIIVAAN